jgi:mono/diheme cytochrome c family protein
MQKLHIKLVVRAVLLASVVVMLFSSLVISADDSQSQWVAPARWVRRTNPVPADRASIAAGKAVYIAQCLECHGAAGKGDGRSAKDLNPQPRDLTDTLVRSQSDGALFWKLTTGREPMPEFDDQVSERDRWNTINYLRVLEGMPSTQPSHDR